MQTRLSVEEWFLLSGEPRGELVEGRLVEEEAPDYVHELLVILLGQILCAWAFPRGGVVGGRRGRPRNYLTVPPRTRTTRSCTH